MNKRKKKNKNLQNINHDYGPRHQRNTKRYRENRAIAEARRRAIKEDYEKQMNNIKKMKVLKDPKFRNKFLSRMLKDGLNDLYEYLKNLGFNLGWLLKEEYGSFWDNFWNKLFGKMGLYGFHTCPYGCGRPIPDAFKGCTELLQVFPDYFDK